MTGSSIKPARQRPTKVANIDRALGPTENSYYLLDKLFGLNFVVYAKIDGPFDTQRLASALQAVQAEHPLLRARPALAGGRPWFKPVAADAHPIPIESGGLRDWRARIEVQLERLFVDAAPLARFMCFSAGARKSVAAMVFHHSIADGRSGADVLIEVLRRAGGEDLPLNPGPAHPGRALHAAEGQGPRPARGLPRPRRDDARRAGRQPDAAGPGPVHRHGHHGSHHSRRRPSPRPASRCRAWAKVCTSICCTTSASSTPLRRGVWPLR